MHILSSDPIIRSGQILSWTLVKDGKEYPFKLQLEVSKTMFGLGMFLGDSTDLPQEIEVMSGGQSNTFHARQYWKEGEVVYIYIPGFSPMLFAIRNISEDSITIYIPLYPPVEHLFPPYGFLEGKILLSDAK